MKGGIWRDPEKPRGPWSSRHYPEVKVRLHPPRTGKFQRLQSGGHHPAWLSDPLIPAQNLSPTHSLLTPAPSTLSGVSQGPPGPREWDSRQEEGESKGLGHSHQEAGVDPTRARGLVGHSGSKSGDTQRLLR